MEVLRSHGGPAVSSSQRLRNRGVRGEGAAALAQTRFERTRKNQRNIRHILRIFPRPFESMYGPNERCHRPKPLISRPLRLYRGSPRPAKVFGVGFAKEPTSISTLPPHADLTVKQQITFEPGTLLDAPPRIRGVPAVTFARAL
jgi:hypothetical protein